MSAPGIILLIDDDNDLREALAEQFRPCRAFDVLEAPDVVTGIERARSERVDLILASAEMPDMSGRDICRRVRAHGIHIPVIMLAAKDSDPDVVHDPEDTASDYMVKPFRFSVLLVRIQAYLHDFEQSEVARFRIGSYEFHPGLKVLMNPEKPGIRLTEKETSILKYLCKADGKAVNRDTLLARIWGYGTKIKTHTLETYIYRLRQKIEPDPVNARFLLTDAAGYRLVP